MSYTAFHVCFQFLIDVYMYNTIQYLAMLYSLYEMRLQGIMVVVFIKRDIQSKMINTTTIMFPCGPIS